MHPRSVCQSIGWVFARFGSVSLHEYSTSIKISFFRSRKGGTRNRKHVEPIEEVLAKGPFATAVFRSRFGGSDNANVYPNRLLRPNPFELPFL